MTLKDDVIEVLARMSLEEKRSFVSRLIFELTIVARSCYEDVEGARLRIFNEVMHRLSGVAIDLSDGNISTLLPIITSLFLANREDAKLLELLQVSLTRTLSKIS